VSANAQRADILLGALRAGLEGDRDAIEAACTADVKVWTPRLSTGSLDELLLQLDNRNGAFSDFDLETFPLDVGGDLACVEWTASMTHTGPLQVAPGLEIEPTGLRVTVIGVTVAEFFGSHICAVRQYWDESSLFVQLGVGGDDGPVAAS
jgi:hypothetical protein